jgi:uncharacterized membrane protein
LVPLLFGGPADYARAFAWEMACFDLAACLLVYRLTALRSDGVARPVFLALLYTLITAALFPVLYTRFDLVPGTLVLAATYCLHARRPRASAIFLGMAGAVKLWPFALVPLWLAWEYRRGAWRRSITTGIWIGAGAVLAALPVLPRAGWAVLSFLQYHAARGIQIETTWATVALLLGRLGIATVHPEHNFGAFHVAGRLPAAFAAWSMPLTVLFALFPQAMAIARGLRSERRERVLDYATFGTVAGFMIAGKVLSPQFMLWIAPLLPLAIEGYWGAALALITAALTTVVYPYLSPALEQREPGHGWALLAVSSRNLLLLGWYALATYRAAAVRRVSAERETAGEPRLTSARP